MKKMFIINEQSFTTKRVKSIAFILFLIVCNLLFSGKGSSQTTLISATGDGGFETGNTFALNGWATVTNNSSRSWYIGTAQPGYTGSRSAFIGANNTSVGTNGSSTYAHLYRSITIPAGATNISLTFKYKQATADYFFFTYYDYVRVYLNTSVPLSTGLPSSGSIFGPYPSSNTTTYTTQTVTIPNTYATGTSINLIFSFAGDNGTPDGYGAIDDVSLTYVLNPSLSATSLSAFGNVCTNNTAGPNSFTLTGTNLTTANVIIGALSGYSYSTTSGGTYTSTLTLSPSSGSINQAIYVKFSPTAVQSYNGNIPVSGGGAATINVAASGAGVNTIPTVTAGAASVASNSATISNNTITSLGCTSVITYGIEYSTTNNFTNGTGTQVAGTGFSGAAAGTFTGTISSGLTPSTTYYFHAFARNSGGTAYSAQGSFTTKPLNDDCSGAVSITANSTTTCTTSTTGTTVGATQSLAGCSGTADDDVWYSFVANSAIETITVTPNTLYDAVFQVYSGTCAGLTSLRCVNNTTLFSETTTLSGLTIGNTYYIRVYSSANGTNKGSFTICVTKGQKFWVGIGNGGSTTNFNDPNGWSTLTAPAAGDDLVMNFFDEDGDFTISLSQSTIITSLTITDYTPAVFLADHEINIGSYTLSVTGNYFMNNSSLFINFNIFSPDDPYSLITSVGSGGTLSIGGNLTCINDDIELSDHLTILNVNGTMSVSGNTLGKSIDATTGSEVQFNVGNSPASVTFNGSATFDDGTSVTGNSVYVGTTSTSSTTTGKIIFKGNVTFGSKAYSVNNNIHGTTVFDAPASQTVTVNSTNMYLPSVIVGNTNNPYVTLAGSSNAMIASSAPAPISVTVNGTSTLDLASHTLNENSAVTSSFNVLSTATLRLSGTTGGQTGSNFPKNFSAYSFASGSTTEYYGTSAQTIYAVNPSYGNLTLTNNATKTAGGALTMTGNVLINSTATFAANNTAQTGFTHNVAGNWTNNGNFVYPVNTTNTINFNGSNDAQITGSAITTFYNIALNKSTSAKIVDVNTSANIGTTAAATTLTTGLLRINSGKILTKSSAGYTILTNGGVHINGGTFTLNNASVDNNGLFKITSGTGTVGNTSGNSLTTGTGGTFDMEGGTVDIASRLVNTAGTAIINGGTLTLNKFGNTNASEGAFNMSLSTNLTVSNSPFIIFQNASAAATPLDLNILNSTGTKTITGGTFQFGNSSTPANSIFKCFVANNIPVYNVMLFNINNPGVQLSNDIIVNGAFSPKGITPVNSLLGSLQLNGKTLTLNSTIDAASSGTITGNTSSNIIINGSGNLLGSLLFNINYTDGYKLNNFTLNRISGSANLSTDMLVNNVYKPAQGTLYLNSNTLTLNGTVDGTVGNAGTLTGSTTANIIVNGSNNLGGSLVFNPVVSNGDHLNNLTINRTSGTATLGSNLSVDGLYIPTTGALAINSNTLVINGSEALTGNGTLTGSATSSLIIKGTGNFGGGLRFTSGSRLLQDFTLSRSSSGRVNMETSFDVHRNLTFTSGIISTGNNLLTWDKAGGGVFAAPQIPYGGGGYGLYDDSYICTCDATGTPVTPTFYTDASNHNAQYLDSTKGFKIKNVSGNGDVYFPIGSDFASPNRMLINMNNSGIRNFTVLLGKGDIGSTSTARVNRIWYVSTGQKAPVHASVKLFFTKRTGAFGVTQDEIESGFDFTSTFLSKVTLVQKDSVTSGYINVSNNGDESVHKYYSSAYDNQEIYAEYNYGISYDNSTIYHPFNTDKNGIQYFTKMSIINGGGGVVLPVQFTGIQAQQQGNVVNVSWTVLNEINIDHYELEHATAGRLFITIANVKAMGSSAYHTLDVHPAPGNNFYRIKAVSKDGNISYTEVASITLNADGTRSLVAYPNPVKNNRFVLALNNITAGKYTAAVYNAAGTQILTKEFMHLGGSVTQTVILPNGIPAGMYILKLTGEYQLMKTYIFVSH